MGTKAGGAGQCKDSEHRISIASADSRLRRPVGEEKACLADSIRQNHRAWATGSDRRKIKHPAVYALEKHIGIDACIQG